MSLFRRLLLAVCVHSVITVKVKVIMHSDQDESLGDDEDTPKTDSWDHMTVADSTLLPFIKRAYKPTNEKLGEYEDNVTTEKPLTQVHPNEIIFPLIYKQKNINSMFKHGDNWYTWAVEKRPDGSTGVNYYVCDDEPKRCDDIGWDSTESLPKCAFQIEALLPNDRACINNFGIEPHNSGSCDGAEQMKVNDIVHSCGPRLRSFWRFVRVGRRPSNASKPADVNSLFCEDEEECFITVEYRIHHDRITFSLHEPTRGQTFKSVLKRVVAGDGEKPKLPETKVHRNNHSQKLRKENGHTKKQIHLKSRLKGQVVKGIGKETKHNKNYNKINEEENISYDLSE